MSPEDVELDNLGNKMNEVLADLIKENDYEPIAYEDLSEDLKRFVDGLNLRELLQNELKKGIDADLPNIGFLLRRMGQVGGMDGLDLVLENIEILHPVQKYVIEYIKSIRGLSVQTKSGIGNKVLELYKDSYLSESNFHKMWLLNLFTRDKEWDNENQFLNLLITCNDEFSKRKLILALGRAGKTSWFQSQWRTLLSETPWIRRALIAGTSCLPLDARKHLYNSIENRLDILEISIVKWVKLHPFSV